jgi:hypothetical protein
MADVQTLLARKADNTYPLSPWLDPSFNTCILDPTPQIDDMLDTAATEEEQQVGTQVGDAKDCLWEKVGDAIFNKNQGGQVLVNTKDPSSKGATFTASRDATAGSTSKIAEIRNTAFALDMTGTGSMLFWTFKHPEVEGQAAAGGVTMGMENNWTLTRYIDFQYFNSAGTLGTGPDNYWGPEGICSDGTFVYVMDTNNNRVKKIVLSDLTFVTCIGSAGTGNDQFQGARDIAYAAGYIYIADSQNDRVVKRSAGDLSYIAKYGTTGSGNDNLNQPLGIACDGTYVYVADGTNNRIVKRLASDLTYVSQTGSFGSGNDQFTYPSGLFTDGTYLWCADMGNSRIMVRLCSDLSYVGKFGSVGSGDGQFLTPWDVAASESFIYVADTGNARIQKFLRSDFSWQAKYGTLGTGQDNLWSPWSLYIADNLLYIADTSNGRIMVRTIMDVLSTYFLEFSTYLGFSVAKKGIVKEVGRFTSDGYLALGQIAATERIDLIGNTRISGQYISWLPVGTMPVNVTSTTKCTNLNADMVDGVHFASMTASRIVVTDGSGNLTVNAALTASYLPYANGTGSLADSPIHRCSASAIAVNGTVGVTDPATWQFTVWNPTSANVVLGVCQDTAANYADIALRNAGGDRTWIWSLRSSTATPTAYALECWYHNGTSWTSPAYLRIAPDGVVTCTVSLTIASLSGILIATAGAVTAITDGHANWDTAYTNRVDTWTSPLALSSNVASVGGLSSIGTANYVVGVNAAGNAWEYKNLIEGANVTITHAAGSITIASSGGGAPMALDDLTDVNAPSPNDDDFLSWDAGTSKWIPVAGGGGGAPTGAKYITQEEDAGLSAEQSLGLLATGIVKNTTTAAVGVLSIAVAGTDYLATAPKLDDCAAPDDNTDLNVSTTAHGLCPKAPNSVWKFLDGTGAWTHRAIDCHMREPFDGLTTGAIHGQGVYIDLSAWVSVLPSTSTMNVAVKSGADKMLRCTSVAGEAAYLTTVTFSNNWGFMGGRVSFKIRSSDVDKGDGGLQILAAGTIKAQVYLWSSGKLVYWNGSTATDLVSVSDATWYEVDMILTNLYCWIFIDGVFMNRLATGTAALWNKISIYATPNATTATTIDYDDLVVINNFGLET